MANLEQNRDYSFVPYAEQERENKAHYISLPPVDWSLLPPSEFPLADTFQRVTVNHEWGWGNETDPRRIRFIEHNVPGIQTENRKVIFENATALIVKERARAIREYSESLVGIGDEEEDLQNLLTLIPGFPEEDMLKIREFVEAECSHLLPKTNE